MTITKTKEAEIIAYLEALPNIDIYADYRDELDPKTIHKCSKCQTPIEALEDYIYEAYWESAEDECHNIVKVLMEKFFQDEEVEDESEFTEALRELVCEMVDVEYPIDHFLNQGLEVNLMISCDENDTDFQNANTWAMISGEYDGPSALKFLIESQGYGIKDIHENNENPFVKSVVQELDELSYDNGVVTFLLNSTVGDYLEWMEIVNNSKKTNFQIKESTMCGLFDPWNGAGSVLEIELEKPVTISSDMIFDLSIDGFGRGYGVDEVYGLVSSCWSKGEMMVSKN